METIGVPKWSSLALRAAASIAFGVIALAWPTATLSAVTILFGVYSMADGVLAFVVASRSNEDRQRWLLTLDGIAAVAAGIVTLLWPGLTLYSLIILIGVRALVTGGFQIGASYEMRRTLPQTFFYGLVGAASVLFGLLLFLVPGIGVAELMTMLGIFCIVFGAILAVWSVRLRNVVRSPTLAAP